MSLTKRLLCAAIGLLIISGSNYSSSSAQGGATFYISPSGNDNNAGTSESAPWATFNRAWQDLFPGDTLILLDGVYYQSLNPNRRNGLPGSPITIRAKNDGQAIIDGQNQRVPVKLGVNGVEEIIEIKLTPEEQQALNASAEAVRELVEALKKLS